jgi:hypothetical protein
MNDNDDELRAREQLHALRRRASAALLNCDDELAAELDGQADDCLLQLATRQRQQMETPAVEPAAAPGVDPRVQAINRAFNAQFDFLDDDEFADAAALARVRLADPRFSHLSPDEFAQDIGGRVRRMHAEPNTVATAPAAAPRTEQEPSVAQLQRAARKTYIEQRFARQYGPAKR